MENKQLNSELHESLGINDLYFRYQYVRCYEHEMGKWFKPGKGEDPFAEVEKTEKFLHQTVREYIKNYIPDYYDDNMWIEFINYGQTEIVFVIHSKGKMHTLLMNQPTTDTSVVEAEYNHLLQLHKDNQDFIVKPECLIKGDERIGFITPYFKQARCIASQGEWGVYIPEPSYRFESFSQEEKKIVTSSMVALLVKSYSEEKGFGISNCKLGGGDFILEKGWKPSTILQHIKLTAARDFIKISFKDYLNLLRRELVLDTYGKDKDIFINKRSRVPMEIEEIERGIQLGKYLRKRF